MPQLFQVLKCYKCSVFQVHQTKKSNKWECKLCGEKQSLKRYYGLGTGKECRLHVQKLNGVRGEIDEANESFERSKTSDEEELGQITEQKISTNNQPKNSKWTNFIEHTELVPEPDTKEDMLFGNTEVVLEVPAKKKRKFKAPKIHSSTVKSQTTDIAYIKEPELEETTMFFCKPDFTAYNNAFSNINSSIINSTISNPVIPGKENNFSKPQLAINKNKNLDNKDDNNTTHDSSYKTFYVPPKLNENSKWAQFAEESDCNKNAEPIKNDPPGKGSSNLFTLCDENELDDVLDF